MSNKIFLNLNLNLKKYRKNGGVPLFITEIIRWQLKMKIEKDICPTSFIKNCDLATAYGVIEIGKRLFR